MASLKHNAWEVLSPARLELYKIPNKEAILAFIWNHKNMERFRDAYYDTRFNYFKLKKIWKREFGNWHTDVYFAEVMKRREYILLEKINRMKQDLPDLIHITTV
jgi:hypothetical protein